MLAPTTKGKIAIKFQVPRRGGVTPPYGAAAMVFQPFRKGRLIFFSLSDYDKIGGAGRVYWGCNQEIRGDKL